MKIGKNKLKMSSGKVRKFKSSEARDRYEKYVQALKHGWKPTGKGKRKRVIGKGKNVSS
jgi:ribosomal protein S6E (S10)